MRDLRRQVDDIIDTALRERGIAKVALVSQLRHQRRKGADKNFAEQELEIGWISKGEARLCNEFGSKITVAMTRDEAFVVGICSFTGATYEGHSLSQTVEQGIIITDQRPELAVIDRGYCGHGEEKTWLLISGMRSGLTLKLIVDLRRRSANEAEVFHMKTDGRLSRSPLRGSFGDAVFAVLCAYMFSPGIWWIGSMMNRSGSDVQILQMYS